MPEVFELELKDRDKLQKTVSPQFGIIQNIESAYRRITRKFSAKTSGFATPSIASYEASKAHKTHMLEMEHKRSQALAEAHRQKLYPR